MSVVVESSTFEHPALLYGDSASYLAAVTAFVRSGLDAGDPVLVAVPGDNLGLVRDALGVDAQRVRLADMTRAGRNPGRIIPTVLLDFAAAHPGRRVRIVGEPIWAGRSEDEYPACVIHEALINVAFRGRDAAVLCPYDVSRLAPAVLDDALSTHPVMTDGVRTWASPSFTDPFSVAARHSRPLPAPPSEAASIAYAVASDLVVVRRFVTAQAAWAGLSADRAGALVLAVNELVANTVEHTGHGGTVQVWQHRDQLICQVRDDGHLADPMAGRLPPPAHAERGRGLLMVNQIADLVRVHTSPDTGCVIRVYLDLHDDLDPVDLDET